MQLIQPITGDCRHHISGGYSPGCWHPRQYVFSLALMFLNRHHRNLWWWWWW